ncbi:hypothetical protein [Motilibacter aurantiacus]|uniref:hypothetical protein n=1 Tax=Motilibacter aurantiacus TaxID=2714955 RepID=UPI00140BB21E|nr:hypothetical protein [Motilibacter aurantiacus]NHC45332.1 hypothetical protein [Motilibacter aurantiacus]
MSLRPRLEPGQAARRTRLGRPPYLLAALATLSAGAGLTGLAYADVRAPAPAPAAVHAVAGVGQARPGTTARPVAKPARPAAKPSTTGRPQEQLTDSEAQRTARTSAWDACLVAHGTPRVEGVVPVPAGRTTTEPIPSAAQAACRRLLPVPPKELNPARNPNYRADSAANVACLRKNGIAVHLVPDHSVYPNGLGWTYDSDSTPTPSNAADIERDCLLQSFTN